MYSNEGVCYPNTGPEGGGAGGGGIALASPSLCLGDLGG